MIVKLYRSRPVPGDEGTGNLRFNLDWAQLWGAKDARATGGALLNVGEHRASLVT